MIEKKGESPVRWRGPAGCSATDVVHMLVGKIIY